MKYLYVYLKLIKNDIIDLANFRNKLGTIGKLKINNLEIPTPKLDIQDSIFENYKIINNCINATSNLIKNNERLKEKIMNNYILRGCPEINNFGNSLNSEIVNKLISAVDVTLPYNCDVCKCKLSVGGYASVCNDCPSICGECVNLKNNKLKMLKKYMSIDEELKDNILFLTLKKEMDEYIAKFNEYYSVKILSDLKDVFGKDELLSLIEDWNDKELVCEYENCHKIINENKFYAYRDPFDGIYAYCYKCVKLDKDR